MKKKLFAILFALVMIVCVFAACGDDEEEPTESTPAPIQSTPASSETSGSTANSSDTTDTSNTPDSSADSSAITGDSSTEDSATPGDSSTDGSEGGTDVSTDAVIEGGDVDCEHEFVFNKTLVYATCAKEGKALSVCSKCQAEKTEATPKTEDHTMEWTEIAPTCSAEGKLLEVCKNCGKEGASKPGKPKTGCIESKFEIRIIKEPTCTTAGQQEKYCPGCGETKNVIGFATEVAALGHTYERVDNKTFEEKGIVFVFGKCEVEGHVERTCKDCNVSDQLSRRDYKKEYENKAGYSKDNYDAMKALEHQFGEDVIETVDATCSTEGYEVYACTREGCEGTMTNPTADALGHKYVKDETAVENEHYVINPKPTCIKVGKKAYICTRCNEVATDDADIEDVACIDHDTTNRDEKYFVYVEEATCQDPMYKYYRCCVDDDCTEEMGREAIGEKKDHKLQFVSAGTCATNGLTLYRCEYEGCGQLITQKDEYSNDARHVLDYTVSTATCCDDAVYMCSECYNEYGPYADDESYKDGFAHNNHVYSVKLETVAPTCSEEGYTPYGCSAGACGTTENKEFVSRISHTLLLDPETGNIFVSPDGMVECGKCHKSYLDITVERSYGEAEFCLGCKKTPCTCGTTVEWEGFLSPKDPEKITAGVEFVKDSYEWTQVADKGEYGLAIGEGLIILCATEETAFTVSVYEKRNSEEALYTFEVSGTEILVDLYEYVKVGKVVITADKDATVSFYTLVK